MSSSENIHIRALNPEDWSMVKEMRMRALRDHPGIFSSSYERENANKDEIWKETLDGRGKCVFGVFDNEKLIGLTAAFTYREDPTGQSGVFGYTYLLPDYRGKSLTKLMYTTRINFALNHLSWKKVLISHRDGNEPSRRAMLSHGFKFTHVTRKVWPDGIEADEYHYAIDLEELRRR